MSPIKCKADIGWPCSLRYKLGKKSSGLVLIKQPFVVCIPSGLAAMETLRLGLQPVLWNRGGRCPFLPRQGVFVARCSRRIQQLSSLLLILCAWRGKSGDDQTRAGLSCSLCSDTGSSDKDWHIPRQPVPSCQCAAFLQWGRGSLEKRARELNHIIPVTCSPPLLPSMMLSQ